MTKPAPIRVPMVPSEVLDRLARHVDLVPYFPLAAMMKSKNQYKGEIRGNRFRICRRCGFRLGISPLLCGQVIPADTGSLLIAEFKLYFPARLLLYLLFVGLSLYLLLDTIPFAIASWQAQLSDMGTMARIGLPPVIFLLILVLLGEAERRAKSDEGVMTYWLTQQFATDQLGEPPRR